MKSPYNIKNNTKREMTEPPKFNLPSYYSNNGANSPTQAKIQSPSYFKANKFPEPNRQNFIGRYSSQQQLSHLNRQKGTLSNSQIDIKNNFIELGYQGQRKSHMQQKRHEAILRIKQPVNVKDLIARQKQTDIININNPVNNIANKKNSLTSSGDLSSHKSEKTLPSFLRNNQKIQKNQKSQKNYHSHGFVPSKDLSKDHFKILKRLGQGKFGSVFLAKHIQTNMIFALKCMQKKRIHQENYLTQFIRQLKIQMYLDHPNIIKCFGFFQDKTYFYTLMELGCDGQLFDIIMNGDTLSEESTSFIIGNLLQAVNYLHSFKIIHRDIKPENIVLVHGNVKLCDFGWAVNKKDQMRSTFCGTPLYLSPQLLNGDKYDEKVDLWAIGVMAYELVVGNSPFNISSQQELLRILTDEITFPTDRKISKQFKQFITFALKKNPKQRLQCKQLLKLRFIKKYRQLQTCEELCQ